MKWRTKRMEFIRVASVDEIPSGTMKSYDMEGSPVLIANIDGHFYAIGGRCTHAGGDLSKGQLIGNIVKCPRHGSQFDVTNGKRIGGPAKEDIPSFETKVEGKSLSIKSK
jgi:nitrite reductase/ring-hydroxylating ferredoxin subunit